MDHVLAKVKGHRKQPFFKLISNHTLFENISANAVSCVVYNPDHNLDEDAWFKIEQFRLQPFCIDFLKSDFDSKDYDDLKKEQFSKIAYILSTQDDDIYFQKITPSLFIRRKTFVFGEVAEVEENENRLIINSQPDAVYLKAPDALIFRNLATISSIFKGIDELYKEATNEEVKEFLDESFINLKKGYGLDNISKPNRKRIALAMNTLAAMSADDRQQMLDYIHSYCSTTLKFDDKKEKCEVNSDEELKLLLYGIEQRFYTTHLSLEKRLANSVQPIE
jgi:hypothetical protein